MLLNNKWSFLLIGYLLLIGCTQPKARMYAGPELAAEQVSIVKTEHKYLSITFVDGKDTISFLKYVLADGKWPGEVSLKPGEHTLDIRYYADSYNLSHYYFQVTLLPSHTYMVRHQYKLNGAGVWIEDLNTNEHVGEILASTNEPIMDYTKKLSQTIYYDFLPPQEDGWMIAYRNREQTALGKRGSNEDETHVIEITLFEIPNIDSEENFLNLVKNQREENLDSERYKILKDEYFTYNGRSDYCVQVHSVVEDSKAVKRSRNKNPMILELVDYFCRHPNNKNIGIQYDYSYRYYPGNEDLELVEKAISVFEQLEF